MVYLEDTDLMHINTYTVLCQGLKLENEYIKILRNSCEYFYKDCAAAISTCLETGEETEEIGNLPQLILEAPKLFVARQTFG